MKLRTLDISSVISAEPEVNGEDQSSASESDDVGTSVIIRVLCTCVCATFDKNRSQTRRREMVS